MINENFENPIKGFVKIIKDHISKNTKAMILKLQDHFIKLENKFDKTVSWRNYYVKRRRKRTLWTPIGDVIIWRKIYINRHTHKHKILFDKHLHLDPYFYIQKDFWIDLILAVNKTYSYKKLTEIFGYEISPSAISRAIKKADLYFKPQQLTKQVEKLYVNVDGIFINQWKDKKYEVKFALAYTDSVKDGTRYKLINKTLFPFKHNVKLLDQANILFKYLKAIYGDFKELIFIGDEAQWIPNLAENMGYSSRYIDQFHYTRFIKKFLPKKYKVNWKIVKNNNPKNLCDI